MSIFSQRLYECRIKQNLTQGELANKIPMTQSSYSRIENGFQEPNLSQLKKISEVLNVSLDYLLDVDTKFYNNQLNEDLVNQFKQLYENYISNTKKSNNEE